MGKNLKGRECGRGICQRKDGLYQVRFTRDGSQQCKYFKTLKEAKSYILDPPAEKGMTVDEWFEFWINNLVGDLAPNTMDNYRARYEKNIRPIIGDMALEDVKQMHCKIVVNNMQGRYSHDTIKFTQTIMGIILRAAYQNDLIPKSPMVGIKSPRLTKVKDDTRFLTLDEQRRFLEEAKNSDLYLHYAFMLETGLRVGELIGLTWRDVDFENRTITIRKSAGYFPLRHQFMAGPTKTLTSYRTIPLTNRAYDILSDLRDGKHPESKEKMTYMDRRSGEQTEFALSELIFYDPKTGGLMSDNKYYRNLEKICRYSGIKKFGMHVLRHTYATRAIERGVSPKILQRLLGHSSVSITMDRYVHVTDDSMADAVRLFECVESV